MRFNGLYREKLPEASNIAFCQAVTPTELIRNVWASLALNSLDMGSPPFNC